MGIMDLFRNITPTATPATANAGAAAAPGQPANAASPNAGGNDSPQSTDSSSPATVSPLDQFKDLWQANNTGDATSPAPLFNVDAAQITEAASKANFVAGVNPELLQAALKGDANALSQAINAASQQAFAQSAIASTKFIEQALAKHGESQKDSLSALVKNEMVRDTMRSSPLYQHEATRPLMEALKTQLSTKHPQATAAQISDLAQQFIDNFANVARGPVSTTDPAAKPASQGGNDFSEFLE